MTKPITKLKSIEDSAIKLFARKGIKEVTIKHIAKEAECSEGALYRHYSGKDEMAWKLYSREVEKFATALQAILRGKGTFSTRLKSAVELFYSLFDENPLVFTFILLSEYNFPLEQKVALDGNPYNLVFEFVKAGVKNGEFRIRDPKLGAAMVLGLVLEPATLKASGRFERRRMSEKIHEVVEACLGVLKAKVKKPATKAQRHKGAP